MTTFVIPEEAKEEIVKSFKSGISIDNLSKNYICTKSTIIRNLKKNLGELKYKEYFNKSKTFDYKKPITVIDPKKNLLGIGFINAEQTNINPKLVLNAK